MQMQRLIAGCFILVSWETAASHFLKKPPHSQETAIASVAHEVRRDAFENIHIEDIFQTQEAKDVQEEATVKANKDMRLLQTKRSVVTRKTKRNPIAEAAKEVERDTSQNIHIHDGFQSEEEKDVKTEEQVKAEKDLRLLQVGSSVAASGAVRKGPLAEVARKVEQERSDNIQIHDGFQDQEEKDVKAEKVVKADKDLKMLQTNKLAKGPIAEVTAQVERDSQENIHIHDGFQDQEEKDVKAEKVVKADRDLKMLQTDRSSFDASLESSFNAALGSSVVKADMKMLQFGSASTHKGPIAEVAAQVELERLQNIHIQDGFKDQEDKDVKAEKVVKADKDLKMLQKAKSAMKGPIAEVAQQVERDTQENIHIHDEFQDQEAKDVKAEKVVKADRDLKMLQTSHSAKGPIAEVAAQVNRDTQENIHIHDEFQDQEEKDVKAEKVVKSDRNLKMLQTSLSTRRGPIAEVAAQVEQERSENIQIHDEFQDQEAKDVKAEKVVKDDKDLKMLQTNQSAKGPIAEVAAQVERDSQENIHIHDGFQDEEEKDIKAEKVVKADKDLKMLQALAKDEPTKKEDSGAGGDAWHQGLGTELKKEHDVDTEAGMDNHTTPHDSVKQRTEEDLAPEN